MIYATVCSGIDAPAVAWKPLGWTQAFSSDIEPFPNAVRAHHDPDVPNYGDMTKFREWPDHDLGLICAGTPCQAFSVAGLRKGLDDPRGNLTLVFLGILDRYRPKWVVWENVPGVLSIDGGRVFGTFLGGLGQLGYGFAYRVLDAQYAGVPQRRRRVFVVGHLGDWRRAAAVLFERSSMRGDSPPRRTTEQGAAATSTSGAANGGPSHGQRSGHARESNLIPQVANPLTARMGKGINTTADEGQTPIVTHSLRAEGFDASEDGTGRGTPLVPVAVQASQSGIRLNDTVGTLDANYGSRRHNGVLAPMAFAFKPGQSEAAGGTFVTKEYAPTLQAQNNGSTAVPAIAFSSKDHGADAGDIAPTLRSMGHDGSHANGGRQVAVAFDNRQDPDISGSITHPIGAQDSGMGIQCGMQVRRLTPRECERLQGFPDDYTLITMRGKHAADGPRYKALGNSMAVPVMRWIGERVQMVEDVCAQLQEAA